MAFATWIQGKNLDPLWVLKICNGSPDYYFSTLPFAGSGGTISGQPCRALLDTPSALPSEKVSYKGGGVTVGNCTFTVLDVSLGGVTPTSLLYRKTVVGKPVELWLGSAAETTFDSTAFCRVFAGLVKDVQYSDGKWSVSCEDYRSVAKGTPLKVEESWLAVCDDGSGYGYGPKDEYMLVKKRKRTPPIVTPTNKVSNGHFASGVTSWTVSGGTLTYDAGAGYGGVAGFAKMKSSSASGVMYVEQRVAISPNHKGKTYGAMVFASRDSASSVTDTKFQLRVELMSGRMVGVTFVPSDIAFGTARKIRSETDGWGLHSVSLTVTDPLATHVRIRIHTATGTTYSARIDDVRLYEMSVFMAMKREIYGVVAVDESVTPNRLTVLHSVLGTRENQQAIDTKGKFVKFFAGRASSVILNILTTTSGGANGVYDRGDGFGCGVPVGYIDLSSFSAIAGFGETAAERNIAVLAVEDIQDPMELIDKEILQPLGWFLYLGPTGLLTLGQLPTYPVSSSLGTVSDADMADCDPSIRTDLSQAITEETVAVDYDFFNATESSVDNDPWAKKAKGVVLNRARTDDPNYLGKWTLDEYDHRSDYVWRDQNRTNKAAFGVRSNGVKSRAIRTFVSASQGMICPLYYCPTDGTYAVQPWKGDKALRDAATKRLSFFSAPPTYIKLNALARSWQFVMGGVYALNSAYLPDLRPSGGGGIGTGDVLAMLVAKQPGPAELTASLEFVVVDDEWVTAPASNPGSVIAGTTPNAAATHSAGVNIVVDIVDLAGLNSGNFEFIPKGAFLGAKITHWYGDVDNAVPNFAGYQYTEVLACWQNANDPNRAFTPVARFSTSRFILVIPGSGFIAADRAYCYEEFTLRFRWRSIDGSYSGTSDITLSPGAAGWNPITIPTTND